METVVPYEGKRKKVNPYSLALKTWKAIPWVLLAILVLIIPTYAITSGAFTGDSHTILQELAGIATVVMVALFGIALLILAFAGIGMGYEWVRDTLRDRAYEWKDVSD